MDKIKTITVDGVTYSVETDISNKADLVDGKVPVEQLPSQTKEIVTLETKTVTSYATSVLNLMTMIPSGLQENKEFRLLINKQWSDGYVYTQLFHRDTNPYTPPFNIVPRFKNSRFRIFCRIPSGQARMIDAGGFQFDIFLPTYATGFSIDTSNNESLILPKVHFNEKTTRTGEADYTYIGTLGSVYLAIGKNEVQYPSNYLFEVVINFDDKGYYEVDVKAQY